MLPISDRNIVHIVSSIIPVPNILNRFLTVHSKLSVSLKKYVHLIDYRLFITNKQTIILDRVRFSVQDTLK